MSSNTANLYVRLSPRDQYLSNMNFNGLIKSSIPTSAIFATYDPTTGILLIKATYTQSIEDTTQMLNISFGFAQIYSHSLVIYTQTSGINA
jgi:hypothetical protein